MMWQSETHEQLQERCRAGTRFFALFPTKMEDGKVVWLEHYWSVLHFYPNMRMGWKNSYKQEDMVFPTPMQRPPPPQPYRPRPPVTGSVVEKKKTTKGE